MDIRVLIATLSGKLGFRFRLRWRAGTRRQIRIAACAAHAHLAAPALGAVRVAVAVGVVAVAAGRHRQALVQHLHVVLLLDEAALPGGDDDGRVGQAVRSEDGHLLPLDGLAPHGPRRRRGLPLMPLTPRLLLFLRLLLPGGTVSISGGGIGTVDVRQHLGYLLLVTALLLLGGGGNLAIFVAILSTTTTINITTTTTAVSSHLYPAAHRVDVPHAVGLGGRPTSRRTGRRRGAGVERRDEGDPHHVVDSIVLAGIVVGDTSCMMIIVWFVWSSIYRAVWCLVYGLLLPPRRSLELEGAQGEEAHGVLGRRWIVGGRTLGLPWLH
mmetsp:Transcript_19630/g.56498  ORF Transcript_19630/g.56498 Transcript_19630/m.56498 type:complete len:325 (-) Transcript_19630:890-1864(-)